MPRSRASTNVLPPGFLQLRGDTDNSPHFSEFSEISEAMLEHYAGLAKEGRSGQVIAFAMLGATLNLYELFGLNAELPALLRTLADRIEGNGQSH